METIIEKLEELGLKHWTKGDNDRIYVNYAHHFEEIFGLKLEFYKTGNIKSAYLNGEKISNSEAKKYFSSKPYYDCKACKWCNIDLEAVI